MEKATEKTQNKEQYILAEHYNVLYLDFFESHNFIILFTASTVDLRKLSFPDLFVYFKIAQAAIFVIRVIGDRDLTLHALCCHGNQERQESRKEQRSRSNVSSM